MSDFTQENETVRLLFDEFIKKTQKDIEYDSSSEHRLDLTDITDSSDTEFSDVFGFRNTREEANLELLIPDGLKSNTIVLKEFLREYYRFLHTQEDSGSFLIQSKLTSSRDVDLLNDKELKKLFFEFANEFSDKNLQIDKKSFLKNLIDFFSHKGNEDSFKNLLKVLIGDFTTEIKEPWNQILHASFGEWIQEKFITVSIEKEFQTPVPEDIFAFSVLFDENGNSISNPPVIETSKVEKISSLEYRLYTFSNLPEETIKIGQSIRTFSIDSSLSDDLIDIFDAKIVLSLSGARIINGGKFWQYGQVIVFPGTHEDTLLRVESIYKPDNLFDQEPTSLKNISLIKPGFSHSSNSIISVSPFKYAPPSVGVFITSVPNPNPPYTGNVYTIEIDEQEVRTEDHFTCFGPGDYFLEDYNTFSYSIDDLYNAGVIAETRTYAPEIKENLILETTVSIEDWTASLARIELTYDTIGKLPGFWLSDRSELSNDNTRLQDNFFYQIFSYVISSIVHPDDYNDFVMNLIHPAGLQRFIDYGTRVDINSFASFSDYINSILISTDEQPLNDFSYKDIIKNREEVLLPIDDDPTFSFTKNKEEVVLVLHGDTTLSYALEDWSEGNSYFEWSKEDEGFDFSLTKNKEEVVSASHGDAVLSHKFSDGYAVTGWSEGDSYFEKGSIWNLTIG